MEGKNADGMVSISELRELLLLNGKEVLNTRRQMERDAETLCGRRSRR